MHRIQQFKQVILFACCRRPRRRRRLCNIHEPPPVERARFVMHTRVAATAHVPNLVEYISTCRRRRRRGVFDADVCSSFLVGTKTKQNKNNPRVTYTQSGRSMGKCRTVGIIQSHSRAHRTQAQRNTNTFVPAVTPIQWENQRTHWPTITKHPFLAQAVVAWVPLCVCACVRVWVCVCARGCERALDSFREYLLHFNVLLGIQCAVVVVAATGVAAAAPPSKNSNNSSSSSHSAQKYGSVSREWYVKVDAHRTPSS